MPVSDSTDPRLADYANLTDAQLQNLERVGGRGVFIAEGELVVRQLLSSPCTTRSVLLTEGALARLVDTLATLPAETPVYLASEAVLAGVVGFNFHRGVVACGERPPEPPLDAVLATARALVVLEDLSNHDNVGGIFRNVAALAGRRTAVLLSPGTCDPLYRKALRVSIGQALHIPFRRLAEWTHDLDRLRAAGFTLLALTPDPGAVDLGTLEARGIHRPALLLGAEGPGLTPAAFAKADLRVRIPIAPGVDSLNVSVAAAVALSRLTRPE